MQVLFVCDNDLVRGPMACALAERFAQDQRLHGTTFASAGLRAHPGALPPVQFVWFMADQRFDMSRHRPSPLSPRICRDADLMLCMTQEVASNVKGRLSSAHAGRVVVLNQAVGFAGPQSRLDVQGPATLQPRHFLALYSQLKASVGRLVRMLGESHARPEDFGATGRAADAIDPFDDPAVRRFLAQGIVDFLERCYEPPTTDHLLDMLAMVGRRLSEDQFLRLADEDLAGIIRPTQDGHGWELGAARPAASPPPRAANGAMTTHQALAILGLPSGATRAAGQRAWRKLLARYHPDKFHDDEQFRHLAEAKTRRLNEAWVLVRESLADEG